jgi:hypothetical protein
MLSVRSLLGVSEASSLSPSSSAKSASASAAPAEWSTVRWLAGALDVDAAVAQQLGTTDTNQPKQPPPFSLFHPDVLCECVLTGRDASVAAAKLNRPPGMAEDDAVELAEITAQMDSATGVVGPCNGQLLLDGQIAADGTSSAQPINLQGYLLRVLHRSLGECWACWCGKMEFTKHSPKVRRHIRAMHAGIDSPSPSPTEDDPDGAMGLAPDGQPAVAVAVTKKGSAAVAGNVRVQLLPPARGIKRARSA